MTSAFCIFLNHKITKNNNMALKNKKKRNHQDDSHQTGLTYPLTTPAKGKYAFFKRTIVVIQGQTDSLMAVYFLFLTTFNMCDNL